MSEGGRIRCARVDLIPHDDLSFNGRYGLSTRTVFVPAGSGGWLSTIESRASWLTPLRRISTRLSVPGSTPPWLNAPNACMSKPEGVAERKEFLRLSGPTPEARLDMALAYARAGNRTQAQQILKDVRSEHSGYDLTFFLYRFMRRLETRMKLFVGWRKLSKSVPLGSRVLG